MSKFIRSDIVEMFERYKAIYEFEAIKNPALAKQRQGLDLIEAELKQSTGSPSLKLRGYASILKAYLPELKGKLGVPVVHGHFTVAVISFHTGQDLARAMKRARVVYDANQKTLAQWVKTQLEQPQAA